MFLRVWILFLLQSNYLSLADHYKGGSISWKPISPLSLTSPVQIIITERHSWTFSRYPCNETIINTMGSYNDTQTATPATLTCISSTAACTSSLYQTINSPLYCTDFSTVYEITTGSYDTQQSIDVKLARTRRITTKREKIHWSKNRPIVRAKEQKHQYRERKYGHDCP